MLQKYSFVIYRKKPCLSFNIPFFGHIEQARDTFCRLCVTLNSSPFDVLYFFANSLDNSKSQLISMAYLKGVYDENF